MNDNFTDLPAIKDQALAWYIRLADGQAQASDWAEFTKWLEKDPKHGQVYDDIELAIVDVVALHKGSMDAKNSAENSAENSTENIIHLDQKRRKAGRTSVWANTVRLAGLAAVLIAALAVLFTINQPRAAHTQLYATNIGELKSIVLDDGTQINLNTNTRLSVTMDKKSRHVHLENGEAYFDIANDNSRPFVIKAMGTKITDIGTAFSVYIASDGLRVSVADGLVDMHTQAQTVRLSKGQKGVQKKGQDSIDIASIDIANISTWRDGVLVFEDAPLSVIVPELNRYFTMPISLQDGAVGAVTFSGVLNFSDQNKLLNSMQALMPLRVHQQDGYFLLSSKN